MNELQFENELIAYIENVKGSKQWRYEKDIKSTEQLWSNFKNILEMHNQSTLDHPLSVVELGQVKNHL